MSLYVKLTSATWSTIRRLVSSGTRWSKQRLPASMWNTGMRFFLAEIAARQEFVSPRTRKASGRSFSSKASVFAITLPIVCAAVSPTAFK